ncbi:hypothetical protein K8P02_17785 [Bacteroides nordii]|nr:MULTISPECIES: hypothetical protein [Bacteroides]MCG4770606.1 hypothetical protein [Bacteroides nordii]MCQ4916260.1 hypothetical protein [Bacteroides nordii]UAK41989.1 hypothetical protein K8P02_17785 [Bacteroides nordii]
MTDICNSGVLPTRGDMTGDADYCNAGQHSFSQQAEGWQQQSSSILRKSA